MPRDERVGKLVHFDAESQASWANRPAQCGGTLSTRWSYFSSLMEFRFMNRSRRRPDSSGVARSRARYWERDAGEQRFQPFPGPRVPQCVVARKRRICGLNWGNAV